MKSPDGINDWVCIDIETTGGRPDAVEEFIRRTWWPDIRLKEDGTLGGWKDETIGERFRKAHMDWQQKQALLDAAEIKVIALMSPGKPVTLLHTLKAEPARTEDYGMVMGMENEAALMRVYRELMSQWMGEHTHWVGSNIRDFDLPRLRLASLRNGVQLPRCLQEQPVFDLMKFFCKNLSVERQIMVSVDTMLKALGMESHKAIIHGGMMDELIARGEHELILQYSGMDVRQEAEIYLRLTGQSAALN